MNLDVAQLRREIRSWFRLRYARDPSAEETRLEVERRIVEMQEPVPTARVVPTDYVPGQGCSKLPTLILSVRDWARRQHPSRKPEPEE